MHDASQVAVGGALLQRGPENVLRPVTYYSRALSKRERNMSTYDRETMAARDLLLYNISVTILTGKGIPDVYGSRGTPKSQ